VVRRRPRFRRSFPELEDAPIGFGFHCYNAVHTFCQTGITVKVYRIAPCRCNHPANRLKEAQARARIARVVVPGLPHHVTQRGNRREPVFFEADDYRLYRRLVAAAARRADTAVWAYCLMPNHVQLIVTPADADGLRATFAEAHRRYTGAINARFRWTGHLFQGRFGAVVMDEPHLLAAARYIALDPVVRGVADPCRRLVMVERSGAASGRG